MNELSNLERSTIATIVSAMISPYPPLEDRQREAVLGDVSRYVCGQVAALPGFLRLPYRLAIIGFEFLPLLRYGRSFRQLCDVRRQRYLATWSDGPLGVTRNFVKLIRSCALLAYFDHSDVRRVLDRTRTVSRRPG